MQRMTNINIPTHEEIVPDGDKYFFITLTSEREDGTDEHISEFLIRNFIRMFPPSYSAVAHVYSIKQDENTVPKSHQETLRLTPMLLGLIRYDNRNIII